MHADAECQQTLHTLPLQKAKIIQNMQLFAAPIVDGTAIFQTIVSLFGWCQVSIIGDIRLARFIVHESLTGPKYNWKIYAYSQAVFQPYLSRHTSAQQLAEWYFVGQCWRKPL